MLPPMRPRPIIPICISVSSAFAAAGEARPEALHPGADAAGVRAFAWFDSATPLRSGWAWGQKYLEGGVAAVEARIGKGRVVLYGPEILQRAQPHGTFKLLFNALYASVTP